MASSHRDAIVRFVLETHREPLVILDDHGRVVDANQAARGAELDIPGLFAREDADARLRAFTEELRFAGKSYTLVATPLGKVYRLEGTAVDGWFLVFARDISEQRAVDEELRQLRARASLGLVAASFIHDFNNLVTPILLLSERLLRDLPEN